MEKELSFQQVVLQYLDVHMQKNEVRPLPNMQKNEVKPLPNTVDKN
jgi:hypothetical protein